MSTTYLLSALNSILASGHVLLMNYTPATATLTTGDVDTTSNEIDLGAGFTPAAVVGTRLGFSGLSNTTNLSNATVYYVVAVSGTEVQISLTPGGSAIDLTATFAGTVTDLSPVGSAGYDIRTEAETVADAVRYEVASYQDLTNRPAFTDSSVAVLVRDATERQWRAQLTDTIDADTATAIDFNYLAIVQGGSATPGNTTGTIAKVLGDGSPESVGVGGIITIDLFFDGF